MYHRLRGGFQPYNKIWISIFYHAARFKKNFLFGNQSWPAWSLRFDFEFPKHQFLICDKPIQEQYLIHSQHGRCLFLFFSHICENIAILSIFHKIALSSELQGTPFYFILQYNIGVISHYKDVGITRRLYRTSCITDYIVNLCYKLKYTVYFYTNELLISYVHKKYYSNWGPHLQKDLILHLKPYPITYKCMHVNLTYATKLYY